MTTLKRNSEDIATLFRWEARRAGGRITISHSTGKVTSIEAIEVLEGVIYATRSCGTVYKLNV